MSGEIEISTESLSSYFQRIVLACNTYERGCEEAVVANLCSCIENLKKLLSFDSESIIEINEENRLASDCVMSLMVVLSQCQSADVISSILELLYMLTQSSSSVSVLHVHGILDALTSLLSSGTHTSQVMGILARVTKHVKLSGYEAFNESVLHLLINNIISNDVSLKASIAVLVNIASGNLPVQMHLRSLDRSSSLRRAIRRLVSHDDTDISVLALAAMTSTGMSDEFNKIISNDKNLDQLLKLSFSMILAVRKSEYFSYSVDLLVHLVKNRRVQQFLLSSCPQLESFMSKAVCLLVTCECTQLPKVFDLLLALVAVPGLRIMVTKLIFAPVKASSKGEEEELLRFVFTLAQKTVSCDFGVSVSAIKFITYIYEALALDPSLAGSTCHMNFNFLSECLKQNDLHHKKQSIRKASCEKALASLNLLEVLCVSETFSRIVLSEVEPATVTDIIEYQIQSNPVCITWNNKSAHLREKPDPCSAIGVEIVLKCVSILMEATESNESFSSYLNTYLQKTSLLPFLAAGISSTSSEIVLMSTKIMVKSGSTNQLPVALFADVLVGINQQHASTAQLAQSSNPLQISSSSANKENIILGSPAVSPRRENVIPSSQSSEVDIAERLASLQMSGDSHISDIISIYEQKLRAHKTSESHLDDLVQAKSMALSQADRLIQQYKSRLVQTESETQKLRNIVHEWERRSEGYREKMNEMLLEREQQQSEMERLLQDSRRLEDTQRTLTSVKRELDTLTEIHTTLANFTDNLKQQHRELEGEYSILKESDRKKSVTISELEAKIAETQKLKAKLDDQCKKLSQEKTNLQEQVESLSQENKRLEKTLKQKEEKLRVIFETLK